MCNIYYFHELSEMNSVKSHRDMHAMQQCRDTSARWCWNDDDELFKLSTFIRATIISAIKPTLYQSQSWKKKMVRFTVSTAATAAIALASTAPSSAFVPPSSSGRAFVPSTATSTTERQVIFWSIKTAIDTALYGLGVTDEVKGTGVWSAFQLKREKDDGENDDEKKE